MTTRRSPVAPGYNPTGRISLTHILSGMRRTESGSFRGNYKQRGPTASGRTTFGAYNIMRDQWHNLTQLAGIPGAPIQSAQAQDTVAAYLMGRYYEMYGDWDLAAVAFYAGPEQANKIVRRGYNGPDSIQNPKIREYVDSVRSNSQEAASNPDAAYLKRIPVSSLRYQGNKGWVSPVAGSSEWGRGSWMPNQKTHRGRSHAAIDIYAAKGTPIVSPVAGKVISTTTGKLGGNTVRIQGNDGVVYYFAHMAEHAVVGVGDTVLPGYHLGYVGNSGSAKSTSPHLHFSMKKDGKAVSPVSYLEKSTVASLDGSPAQTPQPSTATVSIDNQRGGRFSRMLQEISDGISSGAPMTELDDKTQQRAEQPDEGMTA